MNRKNAPIIIIVAVVILVGVGIFLAMRPAEVVAAETVTAAVTQETAPKRTADRDSLSPQSNASEQVAPDIEPEEPPTEILAVEEPVVEEAPVVAAAPAVAPPTQVLVTVIEEGTEMPLERVDVRFAIVAERSEDAPQNGFRGGFGGGRSQTDTRVSAQTDASGKVLMSIPADETLDSLTLSARWGVGPRHTVEDVDLVEGQMNEVTVLYPGRSPITLKLIDPEEQAVGMYPLKVSVQQYSFWDGGEIYVPQEIETNAAGEAIFYAYPSRRFMMMVEADDIAMFQQGEPDSRRSSTGNPLTVRTDVSVEEPVVVTLMEDVVRATATLKNIPELAEGKARYASIEGGDIDYWLIPVEGDTFTFSAALGDTVGIFLTQRNELNADDNNNNRRQMMQPSATEHKVSVKMPDEAGVFAFDIEYPDRDFVIGQVYMPDGEPAKDVRINALGYGEASASSGGGGNQWQNRFLGRIEGSVSMTSDGTDNNGMVTMELPPASTYVFEIDPDSLPEEAKGTEVVELTWKEITEGGNRVVFTLKPSSLLWGSVIDQDGNPVGNAEVNLRGPDIPWNNPLFRTYTDETGLFELNVPPVRLTTLDPKEPPDYYVFAMNRNVGGGLGKAVIDNPDEPIQIQLTGFVRIDLKITNNGEIVKDIEFAQLYTVPGFSQPISSRNSGPRRSESGDYGFSFLIKEITSLNIFSLDILDETGLPKTITIPITEDMPGRLEYAVDFSDGILKPVENSDQGGNGRGGRN